MQCPDCGYQLSAFDEDCPRCAAQQRRAQSAPTQPDAPPSIFTAQPIVPHGSNQLSDTTAWGAPTNSLFCRFCGHPNPADAAFCANCGRETGQAPTPPPAPQPVIVNVVQRNIQNNSGGCGCGGCFGTLFFLWILGEILKLFGG